LLFLQTEGSLPQPTTRKRMTCVASTHASMCTSSQVKRVPRPSFRPNDIESPFKICLWLVEVSYLATAKCISLFQDSFRFLTDSDRFEPELVPRPDSKNIKYPCSLHQTIITGIAFCPSSVMILDDKKKAAGK